MGRLLTQPHHAVDQRGQVVDLLLRDKRDRASAEACFRRTLSRTGLAPHTVVSDHHQLDSKAVADLVPPARHIRPGLPRAKGETTNPKGQRLFCCSQLEGCCDRRSCVSQ